MATCSVCGKGITEEPIHRCYDCGKTYCKECAEKDPTMKRLGICPDCEEAMEGEEDLGRWINLLFLFLRKVVVRWDF